MEQLQDRKLRILMLADDLANTKQWIGGLERYGNAEVINLSIKSRNKLKRFAAWIGMLLSIKAKIKKIKPDVIIGYRLTSYGFIAAWSGFKPCILASQGVTDIYPMDHWTVPFKIFLKRYSIAHANMIHAWGEHMAASIMEHGGKRDQVLVMPRGIDTDLFYPKQEEQDISKQQLYTLCVTRSLYPEYNHLVILKALKGLIDEGYNFRLIIAGKGPELENIKAFIAANNLEKNVHLAGHVPNGELPALLRESDIYISVPSTEGVSASLMEAMASGCFPIVSDLPGNAVLIRNGENGYLIDPYDHIILLNKIKSIIKDNNFFRKVIETNRKYIVENANLAKNMQTFVLRYKDLIAR